MKYDLQMFAEDAGAQASAAAEAETSEGAAQPVESNTGSAQNDTPMEAQERVPYEQIRQLYKDEIEQDYTRRHNRDAVRQRKNSEALKELRPLISRFAKQYGKDTGDVKGIVEAVLSDNAYYEQRAMTNGTTPEIERQLDEASRAADAAREALAMREEQDHIRQQYQRIEAQIDEARQFFPDFDLDAEMENPLFRALCQNPSVSIKTAYQAVHFDEITSRAMQNAVQTAQGKVVNRIKSGSGRPTENGAAGGAPADVRPDPSKMSRAQIRDIIERVSRARLLSFNPAIRTRKEYYERQYF